MEINDALNAFDALSQETRLAVFRLLVQAGPAGLSAGSIAEELDSKQNTMSSHLKQLHQAGLVESRRDGRSIYYTASYDTIRELVVFLLEDCCAGNAAVCRPVAKSLAAANQVTRSN